MILNLMKCKICGKTISPPDQALIIGESAPVRNQKILQSLFSHIQSKMQEEQKHPEQPHTAALIQATVAGENLKGAMLVGHFEISADMEAERQGVLARVHAITRGPHVSDAELEKILFEHPNGFAMNALKDLRDRYEGLGKYAPAQPATATQPEPVTK